jgi:hypothetical protein
VKSAASRVLVFGGFALLGALFGFVAAFVAGLGPDWPYGTELGAPRIASGRVVPPAGVALEGLTVVASRRGRQTAAADVRSDGWFRLRIWGHDDVDLQVTAPRDLKNLDVTEGARTTLHRVGQLEGSIRGVYVPASGIVIPLEEVPRGPLTLRVLDAEGRPAPGARLELRSMADEIVRFADDAGRVRLEDVSVRRWTAVARPKGGAAHALRYAWKDVTPGSDEVELTLPRGVAIEVRIAGRVPSDVRLNWEDPFGNYWELRPSSDASGAMTFLVAPDLPSLSIRADEITEHDDRSYEQRPFAQGATTIREGAVLVLTPIER